MEAADVVQSSLKPVPPAAEILRTLRPEHPRLLATADDFANIRTNIQKHPDPCGKWAEQLRKHGHDILTQPVATYDIPDGLRLLATSRKVLDRLTTLGMLHQIDGQRVWADRAWKEIEAVGAFPDWNPKHFLDTAEMAAAVALAYDWMYDAWTDAQRQAMRKILVRLALEPGRSAYLDNPRPTWGWWPISEHNWNQVCNSGMLLAALAVAESEPKLAGEIVHQAVTSLPRAIKHYAPDGAWAEGSAYWGYATKYTVMALAGLTSALGGDFGLSDIPGLDQAGWLPIHINAPTNKPFLFADVSAQSGTPGDSSMHWLSRRYNQPAFAWHQERLSKGSAFELLYYRPGRDALDPGRMSLDKHFRGTDIVVLRSKWIDPNALFLGFKAGDNKVNHSHLDLGGFVLTAQGTSWADDLGSDDYNLPGYFGRQRWDYYRLRAEGHNTLVIAPGNSPDQNPKAAAPITLFRADPQDPRAVADLTAAYDRSATRVRRGVALPGRSCALIRDEITLQQPATVWWFMHTQAEIVVGKDGRTATLTRDGKELVARILAPSQAVFTVRPAEPLPESPHPAKQGAQLKTRKLAIELQGVTQTTLTVLLSPKGKLGTAVNADLADKPLDQW